MNLTKIISIVLFVASLGLAYYLYNDISSTIKTQDAIKSTERQVIDKLLIIREAEKVYLEQNGKYTSSWDTLKDFINNGVVPITVRVEKVIPLSYGADSIYVRIDTIGKLSAKDRIFKKTLTINCAENGTFMGFEVKEGDEVVKQAKSYKLKRDGANKVDEYSFMESGTVSSLADIKPGEPVGKGEFLITYWNYQFNPDIDIATLEVIPGSKTGAKFGIFTDELDKNGLMVDVIQVWDTDPINPIRRTKNKGADEPNRAKQPLQFGSEYDVNTVGNWE